MEGLCPCGHEPTGSIMPVSYIYIYIYIYGLRVIGISGSLIWSNSLKEQIFNPCGEFR